MEGLVAFDFLPIPERPSKPRTSGLTEVRGPYSSLLGPRVFEDLLELAAPYLDGVKFPGGSFTLIPRPTLRRMIELAHVHDMEVSTGGFLEWMLMKDPTMLAQFLQEARVLGFDTVEISTGYLSIAARDVAWLVEQVHDHGLTPKPEIVVWAGAGSGLGEDALTRSTGVNLARALEVGRQCLQAGAKLLMVESEGLTEDVSEWRIEPLCDLVREFGLGAADVRGRGL
jgi:phosphosulfolactate synthase (CoM biosynthesis protein A)